MLLQIQGHHMPGRVWRSREEYYDNIHISIQVGKEPRELVRGDAESSSWTIPVEIVPRGDGLDCRGPAVQGKPGARFVYLTWGDIGDDGAFAMFRRAKLMLADLAHLVADAEEVLARVDLTDDCGAPRCARLTPPALTLERAD
jgi:hypothetical protein